MEEDELRREEEVDPAMVGFGWNGEVGFCGFMFCLSQFCDVVQFGVLSAVVWHKKKGDIDVVHRYVWLHLLPKPDPGSGKGCK